MGKIKPYYGQGNFTKNMKLSKHIKELNIKIVHVGDYYFCPLCSDRLLVNKKEKSYTCIHCGFYYKEEGEI